jgi:hypothetical protein
LGVKQEYVSNTLMKIKWIIAAVALATSTFITSAQNTPPAGGEGRPPRMFGGPLMEALDANKDGELDATEIENAAAALKALDKNKDGKLTAEELRPTRPPGARGPGDRPDRGERREGGRGPGGERPPGRDR